MCAVENPSPESSQESGPGAVQRTFDAEDFDGLYSFVGAAGVVPVMIHVVGPPSAPRIVVVDGSARARRDFDWVFWAAGANCGAWRVAFDKGDPSPLDPPGPYESGGTIGGFAAGDLGTYSYTVTAEDLRTGNTITLDPDLVIVAMY